MVQHGRHLACNWLIIFLSLALHTVVSWVPLRLILKGCREKKRLILKHQFRSNPWTLLPGLVQTPPQKKGCLKIFFNGSLITFLFLSLNLWKIPSFPLFLKYCNGNKPPHIPAWVAHSFSLDIYHVLNIRFDVHSLSLVFTMGHIPLVLTHTHFM